MPMDRSKYPKNWHEISRRTRFERAGGRCEQCGAPNGKLIARGAGIDAGTYMLERGEVFDAETGAPRGLARGSEYVWDRFVKIVLTVAHLDHDPSNNDPKNLKALCQLHHLRLDKDQHVKNARATRRSRKAARELFEEE